MATWVTSQTEDPVVEYIAQLRSRYSQHYSVSSSKEWWYFTPIQSKEPPKQGWKLHLSALPIHAVPMLKEVVDFLIHNRVQWKVCSSINQLIKMSSPPSPLAQVGKFLTVYPMNDEQAADLAAQLHTKTRQFAGPIIPSDCRYTEDSQVYYRYGAFQEQSFYDLETGTKKQYILTPDGKKTEDTRQVKQYQPDWVTSPFPPQKKKQPPYTAGRGLFGRDLMIKGILRQSPKGGIYAVARDNNSFILKEARFGVCPDLLGRDARDRLTNEFTMLNHLSSLKLAPQPFELFDEENNRYLLMEHLVGHNLRSHIEKANYLGGFDAAYYRELCMSVMNLVQQCHKQKIIIRDLTPNNVLITPDGCKIIDLELAHHTSSSQQPFDGFTQGYVPLTEQGLSQRITFDYDLYALGGILFFILTGLDPQISKEPLEADRHTLLRLYLKDDSLSDLADIASHYLTWPIPQQEAHLAPHISSNTTITCRQTTKKEELSFDWDNLKTNVIAIADHLYETAHWTGSTLWDGGQQSSYFHPACFQTGTAGIAYFFCESAQATGKQHYYSYAKRIIDWTRTTHPFNPTETPPGLYFGYAAVPWVMAMIAEGLNDTTYQTMALELANTIAEASVRSHDITHGAAGIGLMHLALYQQTGTQTQLTYAQKQAQRLIEMAEEDKEKNVVWNVGNTYMWGFAHGAAGIGYFLLTLYAQTGDIRCKELAEKVAQSLIRNAIPTLDKKGVTWSRGPSDKTLIWTHWCNGASGVGQFFLKANEVLKVSEFHETALRAAHAVKVGRTIGSCCQCHGLAGDGDYLLQAGRILGEPAVEQAGYQVAQKLWAMRLSTSLKPGWFWPTEKDGSHAPDYMIGYSGIYSFLLHLFCKNLHRPLLLKEGQ